MGLKKFLQELEAEFDPGFSYHEPTQFVQAVVDLNAPTVYLYAYGEHNPIVIISDKDDRRWGCFGNGDMLSTPKLTLQLDQENVRYTLACTFRNGLWFIPELYSPLVGNMQSEASVCFRLKNCHLAGIRLTDFEARNSTTA